MTPLPLLALVPLLAVHGLAMLVDELYFHERRGLERWERIGHPVDTVVFAAALAFPAFLSFGGAALWGFVGVGLFSCLIITKDEWVHSEQCGPGEQWLHACLFVLHPMILAVMGYGWWLRDVHGDATAAMLLPGQLAIALVFMGYQIVRWNVVPAMKEARGNA